MKNTITTNTDEIEVESLGENVVIVRLREILYGDDDDEEKQTFSAPMNRDHARALARALLAVIGEGEPSAADANAEPFSLGSGGFSEKIRRLAIRGDQFLDRIAGVDRAYLSLQARVAKLEDVERNGTPGWLIR